MEAKQVMNPRDLLRLGYEGLMKEFVETGQIAEQHVKNTPDRILKAMEHYFWGMKADPAKMLKSGFAIGEYNEMITINKIELVSFCAHHLLPIIGYAHFAYLPRKKIVGLSKIPRMIDILSHRPQVQEEFTKQVVDIFYKTVEPRGCAVVVDALHLCMSIRGPEKKQAVTRTTALRGVMLTADAPRNEFLNGIPEINLNWG